MHLGALPNGRANAREIGNTLLPHHPPNLQVAAPSALTYNLGAVSFRSDRKKAKRCHI
jgi:hypothetical protein